VPVSTAHGHYGMVERVSQCVTHVGGYEPLHGVRARGSLTRGVGPRNIVVLKTRLNPTG
jgi:hypothetical protein